MSIQEIYQQKCATPSDINQLLPYLKQYGEMCEYITEFGVRQPTSTYAFLAANPKKLISYDIIKHPDVDLINEPNFEFILGDTLDIEIEETDFLFIDTFHTATQLELELAKHAHKVKKFLGFHDIFTYGHIGEQPYEGITRPVACGRGLWAALNPFLNKNKEWVIEFRTDINNGLLILRRL